MIIMFQLKAENKSRKEVQKNVHALLWKLKLSEKKDFLPSKLSGGQQRRLCLGMALIGNASVNFDGNITLFINIT